MSCSIMSCVSPCFVAPKRHVITVLLLFAIITGYCQRVNFNIALVEMVIAQPKKKVKGSTCTLKTGVNSTVIENIKGGKKLLGEKEQNYVILAFYTGYLVTNFVSGWFSDKYGAKWFMIGGMAMSTIGTGLTPLIWQKFHWSLTFLLRSIQGLGQGAIYPGISTLLSHWAPPAEKATLGGVTFGGLGLGVILGTMSSGLIIHELEDWRSAFYLWTVFGVLWCLAGIIWTYSDPSSDKYLTDEEKLFLRETIAKKIPQKSPIKAILLDPAQMAITFATVGHTYIIFTLVSNLPKYMNNVLHFDIKSNAFVSSTPYLGLYLTSILSGYFADYLIKKKNCEVRLVRICYCGISGFISGGFLVIAGYCNCNRHCAIASFALALAFMGLYFSSVKVNPTDISKNYSGMVMSVSNGVAACTGIATPYVVAKIAPDNTLEQWHLVFWIVFAISTVTTIFYVSFAKGTRSKWDYTEEEYVEFKAEENAVKEAKRAEKEAKRTEQNAKSAEKEAKREEQDAKRSVKEAKREEQDAKRAEQNAKRAAKEAKRAEQVAIRGAPPQAKSTEKQKAKT